MGTGRPFKTIEEHDNALIKNWNKKVSNDDTIYVLGDIFWNYNSEQIKEILSQLNGEKHLILGNHDRVSHNEKSNCWEEITLYKKILIDNYTVILFHYPIADFEGMYRKSIHLYGHVHNNKSLIDNLDRKSFYYYNVSVDVNDFKPVSFDEIKKKLDL